MKSSEVNDNIYIMLMFLTQTTVQGINNLNLNASAQNLFPGMQLVGEGGAVTRWPPEPGGGPPLLPPLLQLPQVSAMLLIASPWVTMALWQPEQRKDSSA